LARDGRGFSPGWVTKSKASMKSILPRFNARRMVTDYVQRLYHPAREQHRRLALDNGAPARDLAAWKQRVRERWRGVSIALENPPPAAVHHDERVPVAVRVNLNGLDPADVSLECLIEVADDIEGRPQHVPLAAQGGDNHAFRFARDLEPANAGLQQLRIRMFPSHPLLSHRFEMGLMVWV
jgi:starch phosphorylase